MTCLTVWFTFLPSFGFILAGAPLVEASRGDIRFRGTAERDHRRGGGPDRQLGGVLRWPSALAGRQY